jgi:hypothetical protein
MRRFAVMLSGVFVCGLTWLASRDLSFAAAPEEPLIVIVNDKSPVEKISGYEVEALFTRTRTRWSDGMPVHPFSFPAGTPAREQFDRVVLHLNADQVGRFWLDRRIRGLGMPPKQVPSAALMLQIIANLPGSIGYVPGTRARPGVRIVARILQGKVVSP